MKNIMKHLFLLSTVLLVSSCVDIDVNGPFSKSESNGNTWDLLFTVPLVNDRLQSSFHDLSVDIFGNIFTTTSRGGIFKYNSSNGSIDSLNAVRLGYADLPIFYSILSINNKLLFSLWTNDKKFSMVQYKNGATLRTILEENTWYMDGKTFLSPNGTIFLINAYKFYVSSDYGTTWKIIKTDDGVNLLAIYNITFDKHSNVFLATNKGVYYSDAGKNNFNPIGLSGTVISNIKFNSKNWLYALNSEQLFVSKDNGSTWAQLSNFPKIQTLSFYINKYNVLFLGTNDGIYRSLDYGETWEYVGLRNTSVIKFTEGLNGELLVLTKRHGIYVSKN